MRAKPAAGAIGRGPGGCALLWNGNLVAKPGCALADGGRRGESSGAITAPVTGFRRARGSSGRPTGLLGLHADARGNNEHGRRISQRASRLSSRSVSTSSRHPVFRCGAMDSAVERALWSDVRVTVAAKRGHRDRSVTSMDPYGRRASILDHSCSVRIDGGDPALRSHALRMKRPNHLLFDYPGFSRIVRDGKHGGPGT